MHWRSLLIAFLLVYLGFGLFLFSVQRSMIYYPDDHDFYDCQYEKIVHNGTRMYFHNVSDTLLVYYHGNAGNACERTYMDMPDVSLLFVEYAGYSGDSRSPTKALIEQDVRNAAEWIDFDRVIVLGRSIGSGAATYHAKIADVDGLILVTPFDRLSSVVQSKFIFYPAGLLLLDKWDNVENLEGYGGPLLIVHGDRDVVIPDRFSRRLHESVRGEYVIVEGGHNDLDWEVADWFEG